MMHKKITVLLTILASSLLLCLPLSGAASAAIGTSSKDAACKGAQLSSTATCDATAAKSTINGILSNTLNILSFIVGAVAVIMIIISGLRFILAQGDSNQIASARNSVIYALVGLIIVALAQFLVHFVLSRVG